MVHKYNLTTPAPLLAVAPIVPDADANVAKFEGGPRLKILIGAWPTRIW